MSKVSVNYKNLAILAGLSAAGFVAGTVIGDKAASSILKDVKADGKPKSDAELAQDAKTARLIRAGVPLVLIILMIKMRVIKGTDKLTAIAAGLSVPAIIALAKAAGVQDVEKYVVSADSRRALINANSNATPNKAVGPQSPADLPVTVNGGEVEFDSIHELAGFLQASAPAIPGQPVQALLVDETVQGDEYIDELAGDVNFDLIEL